jgi:hypothetical protein
MVAHILGIYIILHISMSISLQSLLTSTLSQRNQKSIQFWMRNIYLPELHICPEQQRDTVYCKNHCLPCNYEPDLMVFGNLSWILLGEIKWPWIRPEKQPLSSGAAKMVAKRQEAMQAVHQTLPQRAIKSDTVIPIALSDGICLY